MIVTTPARVLSRTVARSSRSTPITSIRSTFTTKRQFNFQIQLIKRTYSSSSTHNTKNNSKGLLYSGIGAILFAAGASSYYFYNTAQQPTIVGAIEKAKSDIGLAPKKEDFQAVYDDIAKILVEKSEYDDGSYGPVLVRLAWHCSGTYDKETKTGGSNGATMRFAPESEHGANSGLRAAREFLEPVKEKHPWITYSDLWTLAGICAFQEMGGPTIPWRPGRTDRDVAYCTPDGRLPDATKEQRHLRGIFGRMGFNDQEIVALSGAHALGRCHTERSGFSGPWTFSPTQLTNDYYKLLVEEKWSWKKWNGPAQYEDKKTKSLMMLPTDYALIKDNDFKKHVEVYANSQEIFFEDFKNVIVKLFELGVPFKQEERFTFKPSA